MKNVTISLDETLLWEVRRIAAERSTKLNAMIREYLEEVAAQETQLSRARERILELCRESEAEIGPRGWSRGELHAR